MMPAYLCAEAFHVEDDSEPGITIMPDDPVPEDFEFGEWLANQPSTEYPGSSDIIYRSENREAAETVLRAANAGEPTTIH